MEQSPASDIGLRIGHRRNILRTSFYGKEPIAVTEKISPRDKRTSNIKVDDV
jgi:hypothetical protein